MNFTDLNGRERQYQPKPRKVHRLPQLSKSNRLARRYQAEQRKRP